MKPGPHEPPAPGGSLLLRLARGARSLRRWTRRRRRIAPTREGWVFVGTMAAVALAAANTGNNLLYLVFATMLALVGTSGVLSELAVQSIEVERRLYERAEGGVPARGALIVRNPRRRLPNLLLRLREATRDADAELSRAADVVLPILRGGERKELAASWTFARRGRHRLHAIEVSTTWPFGIFEKRYEVPAPLDVIVVPKATAERMSVASADRRAERDDENRSGRGELRELRAFRDGDDPRAIHWRSSARLGQLVAAEREGEGGGAVRIDLQDPSGSELAFERRLSEASAALADASSAARVEVHAGPRRLAEAAGLAERDRLRLRLGLARLGRAGPELPEAV